MARSLDLFAGTEHAKPQQKPRVLMHVCDAGDAEFDGPDRYVDVRMWCAKCGFESDWMTFRTVTESKRGFPCPACNKEMNNG